MQVTISKKRLSKSNTDIFSPRTDSSPVTHSFEDDEPSASKGFPDVSLTKDENGTTALASSCSVPSETSESSQANYSIKTRQKVLKSSSAKKSKTVSEESPRSCQKGNSLSKSVEPKPKHATRTCRSSSDTKQLSKAGKCSKSDQSGDVKKKTLVKADLKDKNSSEKIKNSSKSVGNVKGIPKNASKIKKKPSKLTPKQVCENKKSETKKKKSKFRIQNFLQSPTISQSQNDLLHKASDCSSSSDRSPIPDYESSTETKRKRSITPTHASRSPSRSSSKCVEKLRRSTRCSERASSIAQAESSAAAAAARDSDKAKKSAKRTPKQRERDGSPKCMEAPPLLLSPIPHSSPIPKTLSACAIPTKIIVSIPLEKITRIPAVRAFGSEMKSASKKSQQSVDESVKKDSVLLEKSSKSTSNKHALPKDIKHKPRTDTESKNNKGDRIAVVSKKDRNLKALSESSVKSKPSSVNSKNSIKTAESKQCVGAIEKVSKKRKNEGESKQPVKKNPKTYTDGDQDRK